MELRTAEPLELMTATVFSDIHLYTMFVPVNVLEINFTSVKNNPATCDENVEVFVYGGHALPCSVPNDGEAEIDELTPCLDYKFLSFHFEDVTTFLFGTEDSNQIADMPVGTWWFFALRKSTVDPKVVCPIDYIYTCASNQVGTAEFGVSCISAITSSQHLVHHCTKSTTPTLLFTK